LQTAFHSQEVAFQKLSKQEAAMGGGEYAEKRRSVKRNKTHVNERRETKEPEMFRRRGQYRKRTVAPPWLSPNLGGGKGKRRLKMRVVWPFRW